MKSFCGLTIPHTTLLYTLSPKGCAHRYPYTQQFILYTVLAACVALALPRIMKSGHGDVHTWTTNVSCMYQNVAKCIDRGIYKSWAIYEHKYEGPIEQPHLGTALGILLATQHLFDSLLNRFRLHSSA
jgi:hypothetical protein